MTKDEIAGIAAGLSDHEKTALLCGSERVEGSIATLLTLCLKYLAEPRPDNAVTLTPLGLAVRNHLKDHPYADR
jgi:hypothetical protein